jgi:hypothetical protein
VFGFIRYAGYTVTESCVGVFVRFRAPLHVCEMERFMDARHGSCVLREAGVPRNSHWDAIARLGRSV